MTDFNEEIGSNPSANPLFQDVLQKRLNRRGLLRIGAGLGVAGLGQVSVPLASAQGGPPTLTFTEASHEISQDFTVAEGYQYQVLLRWGDPIFPEIPEFDPATQTATDALGRFGFNCDFVGFVPLPQGAQNSGHGLLVVNHEFTDSRLMFPESPAALDLTREQTDVDILNHGLSVVEIRRNGENWDVVLDSRYNRRITPWTRMKLTGPAAGSARLRTRDSGDGVETAGTYYNCAGGVTPWGTILTGEENVDGFFSGDIERTGEAESYRRFGMGLNRKSWGLHYERWNLEHNPHEPLHVGWIVEFDPHDPESFPMKRTALGRCKHEGCNVYIGEDGTVVAYTGDDQRFEYLYRFVSARTYDPQNRASNLRLLEEGTLSVARFSEDGILEWLPLVFGSEPLTAENGFSNQGDVLIDTRKAADLVGATKMDRPEDVEVNQATGRVFVTLTNNTLRTPEQIDAANPRAGNRDGHILEFWPESGNHADDLFRWEMFLLAGNPATEAMTAYHPGISESGWLSCPDNIAFDSLGNIWIATDGAAGRQISEGIWASETVGEYRCLTKRFLRSPVGCEMSGPFFTPDDENLFCSVQHPGQGSSWDNPSTRWPDFDPELPPRPAVVVITKTGGGRIGS